METLEHLALGDALQLYAGDNPFIKKDEQGVFWLNMQAFSDGNVPIPIEDLWVSPGQIVSMAGDYFSDKDWDMELFLPSCEFFGNIDGLRKFLIDLPPYPAESNAFLLAYSKLANEEVSNADINSILNINSRTYIPFSKTLNNYMRTILLYFKVDNMGELLMLNQTHFTPWAVRVYNIGHHLALTYARCAWFLHQMANGNDVETPDALCEQLLADATPDELQQQAHRFHALSLGLELFTFHYYSDHFAAGHMSQVGDLRIILPQRFGIWGSILANNIHNELNTLGALTHKPFDPTPTLNPNPIAASGDGTFDVDKNRCNKEACRQGMQASLHDIEKTLLSGALPQSKNYGGLEHLPDVDYNFRQMQPLLLIHEGAVYQRRDLRHVHLLSPLDYQDMLDDPIAHGYKKLASKWQAFKLVAKLRVLPFIYEGKVQPVSSEYMEKIQSEEPELSPAHPPLPTPPYSIPQEEAPAEVQKPLFDKPLATLRVGRNGFFSETSNESLPCVTEGVRHSPRQ